MMPWPFSLLSTPELPAWETPVIMLHSPGKEDDGRTLEEALEDAAYALSAEHQTDLATFEAKLTEALEKKGIPFVFVQPGAPGHKAAVQAARKHLVQNFNTGEPIQPCHHTENTQGCRACSYTAKQGERA